MCAGGLVFDEVPVDGFLARLTKLSFVRLARYMEATTLMVKKDVVFRKP
jgi:hypothetical protein